MKKWIQNGKNFIKENAKFLLLLVGLYLFLTFPLPYYIYTGGGIIPIDKRIEIENTKVKKGSFHLAYVSEWKGTMAMMILSKFHKDWEVVSTDEYTLGEDESEKDIFFRSQLDLKQANQNAISNAYQEANKTYQVLSKNFYVYFVDKSHKNPLEVGDKILKVDGEDLTSIDLYRMKVQEKEVGDTLSLTIEKDEKKEQKDVVIYSKDNEKLTGIAVQEIDDYQTDPTISLHFKSIEGGPSGGVTTALAIYNRLVKKDITKGLKIVGTGTIEMDGSVGEIGGVIYKLRGAVKAKADVFLVPSGDNYEECKKEISKKKYKIKLIAIDSFKDAIQKLKSL